METDHAIKRKNKVGKGSVNISILKLVLDNESLTEYEKYYFKQHPQAKNKPIDNPYHPTINSWMIMKRPMMNTLKQKWKDYISWFVEQQGYKDMMIERCRIRFMTYYKSNHRHDVDNGCPKFILDGMSAAGLIVDDDNKHLLSLTLECDVDKDNPRTEIEIEILD